MSAPSGIGTVVRQYKKYEVWRRAHDIVLETYRVSGTFPRHEKYGLTSQMRRASVSIVSNIAEGAGRGSDADFSRVLLIASGSTNELESQVLIARDLAYVPPVASETLLSQLDALRRRLIRLIQSMS